LNSKIKELNNQAQAPAVTPSQMLVVLD